MDFVNESGLEAGWIVSKIEPPAFSLTAVVKGTFKLVPGGIAKLAEEQLPLTGDCFVDDDPAKPLRYAFDFAPVKPRADLLLVGQAHAPKGERVQRLRTLFQVGVFSKTLHVYGDRYWVSRSEASEPIPFSAMPLTWGRAFGGTDFARNPLGKGIAPIQQPDGLSIQPLPNVELPVDPLLSSGQKVAPGGYGPIPDIWPPRSKKTGTYHAGYLKERWPWYPADFDFGFFNVAPEDQQIGEFLRGDEEICLENLHPNLPILRSRLPGLRARCFLNEQVRAHEELREILMCLDTLWVDADAELLTLVWRGHVSVRSEKLIEVHHFLAATEPITEPMADAQYFVSVLAEALWRREAEEDELEPEEEPEEDEEEEDLEVESKREEEEEAEEEPAEAAGESAEPEEEPETSAEVPSGTASGAAAPSTPEEGETEPVVLEEAEIEEDTDDTLTPERVKEMIAARASFEGCDLSGLLLAEFDFSGLNLREAILESAVLIRANFNNADLAGAVLAGANLREAHFHGANLAETDLTEAWLQRTDLTGADLTGADLSKAHLRDACLREVRAADSVFCEADLSDSVFDGAQLRGADLCETRLHRTSFVGADLSEVAFEDAWGRHLKARQANLFKVRAAQASFSEADFQGAKADESVWEFGQLYAANFTGASLRGAEFSGAYLGEAVFDAADLRDARLDEAVLRRARMRRCKLFAASLEKAALDHADLSESNLYEATLTDASLEQTNFNGANLRRIRNREEVA